MKRILVLTGSPHPGGWSHRLADEFVKGAEEGGHEVFRFDAGLQPQGAVHFLQLEEHERTIIDNDLIVILSVYFIGCSRLRPDLINRLCRDAINPAWAESILVRFIVDDLNKPIYF